MKTCPSFYLEIISISFVLGLIPDTDTFSTAVVLGFTVVAFANTTLCPVAITLVAKVLEETLNFYTCLCSFWCKIYFLHNKYIMCYNLIILPILSCH